MSAPILIFGASGGIGSALCRKLAAQGAQLHLSGRDKAKLEALSAEFRAPYTLADVLDAQSLQNAVTEAAGDTGLSGLAYAVGSINLRPLNRLSAEDFERDWRLNALGAALTMQFAAPHLKKMQENASVLLFSSVAAGQGFTAHASISMAKGAVEGLTKALAAELAPQIRVNCIAPSLTRTTMAEGLTNNENVAKAIADLHPMRRLGEAKDAAAMGAFLLSNDASWMTGQIIGVDGGRSTLRTKG